MRDAARRVAVAAGVALGALGAAATAGASYTDSTSAAATYTAGALQPATAPAATAGTCSTVTGDRTVLTWTATTSTWASGYEIARSTTAGGPYTVIATVSGVGTTTYNDGPLAFSTTYYYAIRATKHQWRSADATVSRKTKSSLCI